MSFRSDEDWGPWVLDHGLPAMPAELGEDDVVPIACWAGVRFGVVVWRSWADISDPDLFDPDDGPNIDDSTTFYERTPAGWVDLGYDGGAGGTIAAPLRPLELPADHLAIGRSAQYGELTSWEGTVGTGVAFLELGDAGGVIRRAVDAPVSVVVVCSSRPGPAVLRALDRCGGAITMVHLDAR